jgi:hypothetical protein
MAFGCRNSRHEPCGKGRLRAVEKSWRKLVKKTFVHKINFNPQDADGIHTVSAQPQHRFILRHKEGLPRAPRGYPQK